MAYFRFLAFEGSGDGTAMAFALLRNAMSSGARQEVRAHTLPICSASTRILERLGFVQTLTVTDPEDGPVWRWVYAARAPSRV